jgi:hypothetical protein
LQTGWRIAILANWHELHHWSALDCAGVRLPVAIAVRIAWIQ